MVEASAGDRGKPVRGARGSGGATRPHGAVSVMCPRQAGRRCLFVSEQCWSSPCATRSSTSTPPSSLPAPAGSSTSTSGSASPTGDTSILQRLPATPWTHDPCGRPQQFPGTRPPSQIISSSRSFGHDSLLPLRLGLVDTALSFSFYFLFCLEVCQNRRAGDGQVPASTNNAHWQLRLTPSPPSSSHTAQHRTSPVRLPHHGFHRHSPESHPPQDRHLGHCHRLRVVGRRLAL